MNALVKKEIRLLLPTFAIGGALIIATRLLPQTLEHEAGPSLVLTLICPLMAVLLALSSFGREMSAGTFTTLLAQPISRQKIWDTKISLLALALGLLGLLWIGAQVIGLPDALARLEVITGAAIFGLACFTGGLWTVLLLRQTAAAFWFTILVPGVIAVFLLGWSSDQNNPMVAGLMVVGLGVYSLAGFFFARWLFFRAQDWQWSGGAIAWPEIREVAKSVDAGRRGAGPCLALFRKEWQLHQSQLLIAGVLLVLHLGVIATRRLGHFGKNSNTEFILEIFWLLWLAMPLLVGGAAVAEERKQGTLAGQLCLPTRRWTQFKIKALAALGWSVFLGAVMPLLLEGFRILPQGRESHIAGLGYMSHELFWHSLIRLERAEPLIMLIGGAAMIGGIAFYASTLASNTLQMLAPALAGIGAAWFMLMAAAGIDGTGPLIFFIAVPMVAATMLGLAYRNYQSIQITRRIVGGNLLVLLGALYLSHAATRAVYERAWEKLTPFEPPHGAARWTADETATVNLLRNQVVVRLPDGKFWVAEFKEDPANSEPLATLLGKFHYTLQGGHLTTEGNWTSLVPAGAGGMAGIKTDGTLWLAESTPSTGSQHGLRRPDSPMPALTQFGVETNWSSGCALNSASVLLVKKDGSLWKWDVGHYTHKTWQVNATLAPRRIGTDTNWAAAENVNYRCRLRKTDGSVWESNLNPTNGLRLIQAGPTEMLGCLPDKAPVRYRSLARISFMNAVAGVGEDGTLRICDVLTRVAGPHKSFNDYAWTATDEPIGTDNHWSAVAGNWAYLVALKTDGTVWRWDFSRGGFRQTWTPGKGARAIVAQVPARLGTHADWVAVTSIGDHDVLSLAADGSLWYWPMEYTETYGRNGGDQPIHPLLDRSHKPQWLGNVFAAAN